MSTAPPLVQTPFGQVTGVLLALFLTSTVYALVLELAESRWGFVTDYTWICVTAGCALTSAGIALIDGEAAALTRIAFTVGGPPIIVRSLVRDSRRRSELRQHLEERGDDDSPKTLA